MQDYSRIVDLIHQQKNYQFSKNNAYPDLFTTTSTQSSKTSTQDDDSNVTDGLIEYIFYSEVNNIVIYANGYPVYI